MPATPPALPYTVITPVDGNRSAAELSAELVQLANANRLALTGEEITATVQRVMQASLMRTAEQPPLPEQLQRMAKDCEKLGLTEMPEVGSVLEASLWRAYNAPNRVEILEATTARVEAHLARQQSPTQAVEPSPDDGPSFGYDSGPSIDIG